MIGESHTTRFAREWLDAIQKCLPVRNSVHQQLQERRESQVEFEEGAEQMFEAILETTKKIVKATDATQKALETLSVDIASHIQAAQPPPPKPRTWISITNKFTPEEIAATFTPEGITDIRDPKQLLYIAAHGYYERQKYVKSEHVKSLSSASWIKDVYRIATCIPEIRSNEDIINFNRFDEIVHEHIKKAKQGKRLLPSPQRSPQQLSPSPQRLQRLQQALQQREQQRQKIMERLQSLRQPIRTTGEEEYHDPGIASDSTGATGSGLGSGFITCPNNVLTNVERLEILIGRKRAGNNSTEIINEAADSC